jgi:hypothetical protein
VSKFGEAGVNGIRLALSYVAFVLAALFALLWLRSYFYSDIAARTTQGSLSSQYSHLLLESINGVIRGKIFSAESPGKPLAPVAYQFRSRKASPVNAANRRTSLGFYWKSEVWGKRSRYTEFSAPHWTFVLVIAFLAIALRPKPRWRYGVRDLFVFLTVTAIIVGIVVTFINSRGLYGPPVDFHWV